MRVCITLGSRTLVSIAVIFALDTFSLTLPKCFTYATSVSGWFDMYMQRKVDLSATGSFVVAIVYYSVVCRGRELDVGL